jgi:hypothetical protein
VKLLRLLHPLIGALIGFTIAGSEKLFLTRSIMRSTAAGAHRGAKNDQKNGLEKILKSAH